MKVKPFSIILLLNLVFAETGNAQNYSDLLRYSQKFYQGNARSAATGNAFGAVGADFTAISINPAGLALYRKPEFTFGFAFNQQTGKADYLGNRAQDDKYNLNMSNLGLVLADVKTKLGKPVQDGWVSVNFGMGFARTNNFHNNIAIEGLNKESSILDSWTEQAQGFTPGSFSPFSYPSLGYNTGLLQTDDQDSTKYYNLAADAKGKKFFQGDYLGTRGSMNDISLSVAGNYSNKFYIGGSLLVPVIGYHCTRIFTETNLSDSAGYYNSMKLTENVNTSGVGISAAFGAIFRPSNAVRLGLSLQLPTFYSMYDSYNTTLSSQIDNGPYSANSPSGTFEYSIVTPMRTTFSTAFFFGKQGLISADYEWMNFASARINSTYDGAREVNNTTRNVYKAIGNLRLGGEYRYENIAFRAGYQMHGSPFQDNLVPNDFDGSANVYSAGLGLRDANYFLDFTYQYIQNKYFSLPYSLENTDVEGANVTSVRNNIMVTVGSRF